MSVVWLCDCVDAVGGCGARGARGASAWCGVLLWCCAVVGAVV